jgi:hypothetical protein
MAADTIVPSVARPARPARWAGPADRAPSTAARAVPRGPGLATVVALPVRQPAVPRDGRMVEHSAVRVPTLRVVSTPERSGSVILRAIALLAGLLLVIGVLGTLRTGPEEPIAAGHVVLQPGETLWDIAVRSAPAGVDPRRQLDVVRRLNGFGPGALDAWTVVLIPAP